MEQSQLKKKKSSIPPSMWETPKFFLGVFPINKNKECMSESEDELPSFWIIESNTMVKFSWQKMSERKPGAWEKYL